MVLFATPCASPSFPEIPPTASDQPPTAVSVAVVSQVFAVPPADLLRTTRGRAGVALARQIAMYLAHVVGGQTLTDIGAHFSQGPDDGRARLPPHRSAARRSQLRSRRRTPRMDRARVRPSPRRRRP